MRLPVCHLAWPIVLVVSLGATGCSSDGGPPDAVTSRSLGRTSAPPAASEPSASNPAAVPTPAAAISHPDAEGARAFIDYYWAMVNYAQRTGNTDGLRALSAESCEGCQTGIEAVERLYRRGGSLNGGDYTLTVDSYRPIPSTESATTGAELDIAVTSTRQVISSGSGTSTSAPATTRFRAYLLWNGSRWRIDVLDPA